MIRCHEFFAEGRIDGWRSGGEMALVSEVTGSGGDGMVERGDEQMKLQRRATEGEADEEFYQRTEFV